MQTGGLKSEVDFNIFLKNNIFKASTDKLYFKKTKKSNNKIYLTLHDKGIIEFNNLFFKQGQNDYYLLLNPEKKLDIPENINKNEEKSILYNFNDLKKILFNNEKIPKTKSLLQFLYYEINDEVDSKYHWLPIIGKINKFPKGPIFKGKPWNSKDESLIRNSKNYVLYRSVRGRCAPPEPPCSSGGRTPPCLFKI